MAPRHVVLDTNFLLVPFQFKIDIMRELDYIIDVSHRYVVSSKTIKELKKIGESIGKDGMAARLALKLVDASRLKIDIIESDEYVDKWIEDYALANNAIVCTNDARLRKRLRDLDVKVVSMKSRSRLGYI
jgi:rRNA-processing protein FCF1